FSAVTSESVCFNDMIVAQDFVAGFLLFHNEHNINALAVTMSFNFVFALITLFKLRFKLNILFNCYCIKMLMLKVFAQQMLRHFRSYGRTFKIKVRYTLLLNSLLNFAYTNAINRD